MNGNPIQMLTQMMSLNKNPQQFVQNMMRQNPQYNAVLNQQRQSGMSMEQYVRNYAQQKNMDIDSMINFMRQQGFRI